MAVAEFPILFSGEVIPPILTDQKTQTRRILKWRPRQKGLNLAFSGLELGCYSCDNPASGYVLRSRDGSGCWNDRTWPAHCPYGRSGDRLWVREAWRTARCFDDRSPRRIAEMAAEAGYERCWAPVAFADGTDSGGIRDFGGEWGRWRRSIFMPRWASRITLEVTEVRVQRLRKITAADACEEGAAKVLETGHPLRAACFEKYGTWTGDERKDVDGPFAGAVDAFATLWDSINGKRRRRELIHLGERGYPGWRTVLDESAAWASNPWVWAVTFRRLRGAP